MTEWLASLRAVWAVASRRLDIAVWEGIIRLRAVATLATLGAVYERTDLPFTDQIALVMVLLVVAVGYLVDKRAQVERRYYLTRDRKHTRTEEQLTTALRDLAVTQRELAVERSCGAALKAQLRPSPAYKVEEIRS